MATYRLLPEPPARPADCTIVQRGLQVLGFVITHRLTCTISDLDLQYADHAGVVASAGQYDVPGTYDTISRARLLVAQALRTRQVDKAAQSAPQPPSAHAPTSGGGAKVPVAPTPGPMAPRDGAYATVRRDDVPF